MDYSNNKLIFRNTLTLGMGSVQMDIGVLTEDVTYSVSPAYRTFRIRDIEADYLRYCLEYRNQDMFSRYAKRGSRQGKTIDLERWMTYEIPVHDVERQKEIVSTLDAVSDLIRLRKRQLEELDLLVKARFVEMFGDPVENEKGWKEQSIESISKKIGSGATPRGGQESYVEDGISLIRSMNVYNGVFKYRDLAHITEKQASQLDNVTVQSEDILLNITGASVARCCIAPDDVLPARVNQHVSIIRCKSSIAAPIFMIHVLISDSYQRRLHAIGEAGGATRQAITKKQIEELTVITPPIELQHRFIGFVNQIEKLKVGIHNGHRMLGQLSNSLMQKYFG